MNGRMTRCRLAALVGLFALYLAAAILLSSVALHEPRSSLGSNYNRISGGGMGRQGVVGRSKRVRPRWCKQLRYVLPLRTPTALVSFPGSGNTWLRYMLQQATGFRTGSVYDDGRLSNNGFPAEGITNGSVLVVKTHEWGPKARAPFEKAVLLVRSPEKAIQAEFNRRSGGHIGFASPDKYRGAQGKHWQNFVADQLNTWRQTNMDWLVNFVGPVHIVFYDDLVTNLEDTLRRLLQFLDIPIEESMLQCALERKEGIYRRKGKVLSFDPFTQTMKRKIATEEEKVYTMLRKLITSTNPSTTAQSLPVS